MDPAALEFVLRWEGGEKITNSSEDPGGLTKWGISQRSYPMLDIASLTREQAEAIYERDYWQKTGCGLLPPPLALCVFNAAVNCGTGRALRWLSDCDGDYRELIRLQIKHYLSLKSRLYLGGWIARTVSAWEQARKMEA